MVQLVVKYDRHGHDATIWKKNECNVWKQLRLPILSKIIPYALSPLNESSDDKI
jgi:hypothetical protein